MPKIIECVCSCHHQQTLSALTFKFFYSLLFLLFHFFLLLILLLCEQFLNYNFSLGLNMAFAFYGWTEILFKITKNTHNSSLYFLCVFFSFLFFVHNIKFTFNVFRGFRHFIIIKYHKNEIIYPQKQKK